MSRVLMLVEGPTERSIVEHVFAPVLGGKGLFPGYRKGSSVNAHAYRIAQHIGLERIRRQCPHFNEWITKLEQLVE